MKATAKKSKRPPKMQRIKGLVYLALAFDYDGNATIEAADLDRGCVLASEGSIIVEAPIEVAYPVLPRVVSAKLTK